MNYTMPTASINEGRRIMKENPITTYLVMAVIVITSSQPSSQARIADAWRRLSNGLHCLITQAMAVPRHLPHGVT
eukprot:5358995-Pleurochrysis_carterae.AAC.1